MSIQLPIRSMRVSPLDDFEMAVLRGAIHRLSRATFSPILVKQFNNVEMF
jgi:hypothetical protein